MSRFGIGLTSGLVWAALAAAVAGVILTFGPAGAAPAPGHEPSACRPCRSSAPRRGPALPFEIDESNVRLERPAPDPGPRGS